MNMRCVILAALLATPALANPPAPIGTWINPDRNVTVVTRDCGQRLCGWVAWSTPEASAEARDGGTENLVGTELLQDYRPAAGAWRGRVLVPDLGRSFDSRIQLLDPDRLKVSGCLLHGLLCKSQVWQRVASK